MIRVSGLTRSYGDLRAVDELSFEVASGEILGLVGANGAGKTTCLHCLAGILEPDSGRLKLGGIDFATDPLGAKSKLAFIPDTPLLFDHLTVHEHLQFVARIFQVDEWQRRADELLAEFELDSKRSALPSTLSRGMKQKLAICMAFLHEPVAILCDEPLSGLDPMGIRNMRSSLQLRARNGAALIISSHQLELVAAISDRVLILDQGRNVLCGSMAEIRADHPELGDEASLEELFLATLARDQPKDLGPDEELRG